MAVIEAKELTFTYPNRTLPALENVTFSVNEGELVLLMGRSGSGKTTMLRLMKKEIAPFGKIGGTLECGSENIGFVFQNPNDSIITDNVISELAFSIENAGADSGSISRRIGECSAFFNLQDLLDKKTEALSGGEKQTVSLAASMMTAPDVLLLDEPCAHLDPVAEEKFVQVILRLNRELGTTVIISAHDPEKLLPYADRVMLLEDGSLTKCAPPLEFALWLKKENHEMLSAMPPGVRLFEQAPLTVREAIALSSSLSERSEEKISDGETALELKHICFAYDKKGRDILFDLSYKAQSGKINAVIGANGSGKSTLMKVIAGVLKPYSGKVKTKLKAALLPQTVQFLFTHDEVGQEIGADTAEALGIGGLLSYHPLDLSGGEARLLGLGIVLETGAELLLLDEPTAGLDAVAKQRLAEKLKYLCAGGKTVLLVTHDLEFAGKYADCVSFLCDKRLSKPASRREFFSQMELYTTQVRRITRRYLKSAVSEEDIL